MIPVLYDKKETEFTSNGLGRLADVISCVVTEELNSTYELTMQYPIDGIHYKDLVNDNIILAIPSDGKAPEPFRIYKVSRPMNGQVTVDAEHISYQLSRIPVMPFTADSVANALQGLKTNAAQDCPFTFYTDRTTGGTYKVEVPCSIRSRLGGSQGSILDVYGHGEYEFVKWRVNFLAHRGQDRGVVLRYGKNLTDIKQEENIQNVITGICPYWAKDGVTVTLPEKIVETTAADNYAFQRTSVVDFSGDFETQPTVAQLRTRAQTYINDNRIGIPSVSIDVSFIALWQTEEYKDIAVLERINLADTITVVFEDLGVNTTAQVVKTVYNVLLERYESLHVGDAKTDLANIILKQSEDLDEAIASIEPVDYEGIQDDIDTAMAQAKADAESYTNTQLQAFESSIQSDISDATDAITGNDGGYVVIRDKNGDGKPDEILIMNTADISTATKVWRWNNSGLGYSSNGYNGTYATAITQDGKISANFITTGQLNAALATIINLNASNITTGILQDSGGNFVLNMSTGLLTAKKLVIDTTNFDIDSSGNVTLTGKVTASSGKIGIFDIDSDNGIKFLGREVASNTSSPYVLVQLYRSRLRFWYNTTSTGAFQNGTKEIFGVQYSAINRNCFVTGVGFYSTGDVVSDSFIIGGSGSNNYFTLQRNGSTTNPAVMRFFKFDSSSLSYKKTIDISGEGEIIQPYTGGHSSTSASGVKRQIRIAEGKRIELDYGLDQNNSSYGDMPELVITAWNNVNGNIDTQVISNAYMFQAPYIVQTSDRKLKDLIEDMDADKVKRVYEKLRPRKYIYKSDHESVRRRYGLIAQEVLDALATVGITENDTRLVDLQNRTDGTEFYALCYDMLHAFHISMVQQQEERITELEIENRKLWAEIDILKKKVEEMTNA